MEKYKNLKEYFNQKSKYIDISDLFNSIIKTSKFKIVGNCNGHNYDEFLDDEGFLTFNNINIVFDGENVVRGCINEEGRAGNTISIKDLYPILVVNKLQILKEIEAINKNIDILEQNRLKITLKLEYLIKNNKKELTDEEYEKYAIEQITGIELPIPNSNVVEFQQEEV
jgi:hypothetical protein